jgi:outer membrane protein
MARLTTWWKLGAAALFVASAAPTVVADVLGGDFRVSYWNANTDGDLTSGGAVLDFERDLNADDTSALELSASLEHPLPFLPNIRLTHISLDDDFNGDFTGGFDGQSYSGAVTTSLDMSNTGLTLYYEVLDNIVSADIGIDVRRFDGELRIQDNADPSQLSLIDLDETIPLLYAGARVDLPFTGLSVGADLSGLKVSDNQLTDAKIHVRYDISLLFIEAGYRVLSVDLDDIDGTDVSADLNGVFISSGIDF